MITTKRIYEEPSKKDGYRILIDRLWPRGKKKSELPYDEWLKVISPSNEIRQNFGHAPEKWAEFKTAYLKELKNHDIEDEVNALIELAKKKHITLLYSARDEKHNNAVVLKQFLERKIKNSRK